MATETKLSTKNIIGIVIGIVVLGATVFAISYSWKKGQNAVK